MANPNLSHTIASILATGVLIVGSAFVASGLKTDLLGGGQSSSLEETGIRSSVDPVDEVWPTAPAAANLTVEIKGIRHARGKIVVLLYGDAASFNSSDYESAIDYAEIDARTGTQTHEFSDLVSETIAVTIFHDENGDGQFNMAGELPLEAYGTSGATGPYDMPSFSAAQVANGHVAIQLHYPE